MARSKKKLKWEHLFGIILGVFLAINLLILAVFTTLVNSKITTALETIEPQQGTFTVINPIDCPNCRSTDQLKTHLLKQNLDITDTIEISSTSPEAIELIAKLGINKLPALIFSSKERITTSTQNSILLDGKLIGKNIVAWEQSQPPYFNIQTNAQEGLVSAIYLTDNSCTECYDVIAIQKQTFQALGVNFVNEISVDISTAEGQELLDKYAIESVPTIILSKDMSVYAQLIKVWDKAGTIAKDGSYIFRKLGEQGLNYRDLKSGDIITNS